MVENSEKSPQNPLDLSMGRFRPNRDDIAALLRELIFASSCNSPDAELLGRCEAAIRALTVDRDEADRSAGEITRWAAHLEEEKRRRELWLAGAKRDAGFRRSANFDGIVWPAVLGAYQREQEAMRDAEMAA